jgi:predicted glycosyltransferase
MREFGRALADRHDVYLFAGGGAVPVAQPTGIRAVPLPGIRRREGQLAPLRLELVSGGPGEEADVLREILARRIVILRETVAALRPDVLVIEHYPFSKWDLEPELLALIEATRAANPAARIVCSVRDLPLQTSHEPCAADAWAGKVAATLNDHFDALVVHGEESLTPLTSRFPRAGEIRIPWRHTGIVAEPLVPAADPARVREALTGGAPFVLASVGGGADDLGLLDGCRSAWRRLVASGGTGGRMLVLCQGLSAGADPHGTEAGVRTVSFSPRFLEWLVVADLSVSCTGYNTCANLLATRTRALLAPNPRMSDQPARGAVMAELGLAGLLPSLEAGTLGTAMAAALCQARPRHDIPLDGAGRAARFVEELAG